MGCRASLFPLLLVLVACGGSSSAPPETTTSAFARDDADAIVAKVSERYASAKTYADEGTFRIVYRETDGREKHQLTGRFRTRWRAPDRLVFVMDEDAADFHRPRTVTASFGSETDRRSLAESLAALHGQTNGLSGVVPLWLVEGFRPARHYALRGRAPCGDGECHVLESIADATDKTMLLVDTRTFALHRIVRHTMITPKPLDDDTLAALPANERERVRIRHVDPFVTDDDIVITPRFDERLPDAAFELAADRPTASSSRDRSGR